MLNRREFINLSAGLGALALLGVSGLSACKQAAPSRQLVLPSLPYPQNALAPYISEETIAFHYGKHHQGYLNNANKLLQGTPLAKQDLETIIQAAWETDQVALFNNAAQVFNHTFYWHSMRPDGGGAPEGDLAVLLESAFGSYQEFYDQFASAALNQFASGWAWLVQEGEQLAIMTTSNAETPIPIGKNSFCHSCLNPLLTLDVWEHAYYLDYQNRRADYITAWLDHLVNWNFAEQNLII